MNEGHNESQVARAARETRQPQVQRSALDEEVQGLAEDPVDSAERRAVMADMDAVAPDWPQ